MERSGSLNISYALFNTDNQISEEYGNTQTFINQSRMSTFYQDNPFPTLTASSKYGIDILGGPVQPEMGTGHRPFNVFAFDKAQARKTFLKELPKDTKYSISQYDGIIYPSNLVKKSP